MKAFDHNERERDRNPGEESPAQEMEVDSDVNQDPGREAQLDDSFETWYRNIGYWVQQKEEMTQVPEDNVFEAAVKLDAEEE